MVIFFFFEIGANEIDFNVKAKREEVNLLENLIPSISSTGVLLKTIESTPSSIDFVFVLNVRESETYPPLLLPQDLACVEDKLSGYRSSKTVDFSVYIYCNVCASRRLHH